MYEFRERFKEERMSKGITQSALANILGVDRTSISKYENGKQLPEVPVLEKIATFFEVTTDYLLGKTNIRNNINEPKIIDTKEKDIEKAIDELMGQQGLMLSGEPLNEEDLFLLRNSIRNTIEFAKNLKKKK